MTPSWVLQQPGGAYPTGYSIDHTHSEETRSCEGCHRVQESPGYGTRDPLVQWLAVVSRYPGMSDTASECIDFYSFSFSTVYRVWIFKDMFTQLYSIVCSCSSLLSSSISVRFWYRVLRDSIYSDFSCSTLPHTDSIDFISAHWDLGLTPLWELLIFFQIRIL